MALNSNFVAFKKYSIPRYVIVQRGISLSAFRKNLLPSSSGYQLIQVSKHERQNPEDGTACSHLG
jgi:hypothetical protein